jgi:hypothetical protein
MGCSEPRLIQLGATASLAVSHRMLRRFFFCRTVINFRTVQYTLFGLLRERLIFK